MAQDSTTTDEKQDEFFVQYGKTIAAWASLELALNLWFCKLTNMDGRMSTAIFYSGRSFQTRRDVLLATLEYARIDQDTLAFLRAALKKSTAYSNARNQIAHRLFHFDQDRQEMVLSEGSEILSLSSNAGHTISGLGQMMWNFHALDNLLLNVLFPKQRKNPLTPQEGLARVRELPNLASEPPNNPSSSTP